MANKRKFRIKAIKTKYDGYEFQSRIEARWAIVFNFLGQPYEYEKEGYELPNGEWYLCDYWLPKDQAWVEIKGKPPTKMEIQNLSLLANLTECRAGYIFYGPIPHPVTWRQTWKTISVVKAAPRLFPGISDARISAAFKAAREKRF